MLADVGFTNYPQPQGEQEFQKATEVLCVDGGASLHTSHRQLKQWVREVNAAEPPVESRKLLKWSSTPIIFDIEDHPDRVTAVGCLPMLVSPTIRNLKVSKMLVDGGAGLNLISSAVLQKLQIPDSELEETGTFQGINPGRSKPRGKITLPVTFGSELNFRTERVTFDVADFSFSPTIRNLKVTKMLVDGGAGLNLISSAVLQKLQIPDSELEETGTFQGISPGRSKPKGKITLPVTFGSELNFRTERVMFDVADFPLPYNGILGRPALAKFMAASHYAYN